MIIILSAFFSIALLFCLHQNLSAALATLFLVVCICGYAMYKYKEDGPIYAMSLMAICLCLIAMSVKYLGYFQ
jgi:cytochrome bd-type quinol oxidase subunit 1